MKRIVVATGNMHKVEEIATILAPLGFAVVAASAVGAPPKVIEDGETYEANAIKKASQVAKALGVPTLADDSGLSVDALDGRPGVHSARFAGETASDRDNLAKLLDQLRDVKNRAAKFVCVISLADACGNPLAMARGEIAGRIIDEPRGEGGFGYDPIFVPNGYRHSFAELPSEIKHSLSHRGEALRKLVASGGLNNANVFS